MKIKKENILLFLIASYILVYSTILLEPFPRINYAVKALLVISFILYPKLGRIQGRAKLIIFLYTALLLYALLIIPLNNNFTDSIFLILKYGMRILVFAMMIMILQTGRYSERVVKVLTWIAVILSIQSIILFVMIYLGCAPELSCFVNPTRGVIKNFGIWGYANALQSPPGGRDVLRLSSFFSEPSNFAAFLEYALFVLFGYFKLTGEKKYLVMFIIILIAFVLTFSVTGYIAVILAIALFHFFNHRKNRFVTCAVLLLLLFFLYKAHLYFKQSYIINPSQRTAIQHLVFSKYGNRIQNPYIIYGGRVHSNIEGVKLFLERPFGIGLVNNAKLDILKRTGDRDYMNIHLAGAHLNWLVKTGFFGFFIFILIFAVMYKQIKTIFKHQRSIRYYITIAFISITLHHMGTGNWISPLFLFVMSLILVKKLWHINDKSTGVRLYLR